MQIWRTTRSSPGTSCMKVRLVRPRCFVLTMLPLKSLVCFISLCLWVFEFLNATRRDWNLPQKRESFFSSPFTSEERGDEVKEFMITERTVKVCLLHFRLEYLRKCVTGRVYFQVGVIWLNAFTGFNDGCSWSSFAWWFHCNIFFVRFSLSKVLKR